METYKHLGYVLRIAELIACICGFVAWQKWKGTPWRWFLFYLLFIVLAEAFGAYTFKHHLTEAKNILFNFIVIPCEFLTAFFIFYSTAESKKMARLPIICTGIYLAYWLMRSLYNHHEFNSFSYTIGGLLMLVLILRFLINLATSEAILTFRTNMLFWVCTGWLLFYLVTLPYYGLRNNLMKNLEFYISYSYLQLTLNSIMYLLFAIGFLWSKPKSEIS